jgi:hypothetical protein
MKKIGGPHDGQTAAIAENPGDPELKVPGSVLEYDFTDRGKVRFRFYIDANPTPSIRGEVERYQYLVAEPEEGWYYVQPQTSTPDPSSDAVSES